MPMPERVARGAEFERRFIEWFVRTKVDPRSRANRGVGETGDDAMTRQRLVKDPTATRGNRSRRGRIDVLAIIDDGNERVAVIIELKASDWTAKSPENVRRKVARHAAQLYSYQGHLT